ncbi:Iron-sulfur assembly protein 1 [Physocladia obscura]|uniref:Iron-sulfur assembly protein 1 n=1 Tax=Physocladia obscura TaxID=109957 RepID=A0AAD5SUS1_9FUNG|nr:Iron-sulfur assembly protein 1 [Physocladia obscura]
MQQSFTTAAAHLFQRTVRTAVSANRAAGSSPAAVLTVARTASISIARNPVSLGMLRSFSSPPTTAQRTATTAASASATASNISDTVIVTNKKPSVRLARKAALTLTPAAVDRLRELYSDTNNPKLLKVGTSKKGCSGQTYNLEYVSTAPSRLDEIVEQDGVRVLIDSKALFSLIGSEMDFIQDELSSKFVFNNPNVKEMCGCGESFMHSLIAKDPFADIGDDNEAEVQGHYIHIRIQQRNGRKTLTTVQGLPQEIDPKKVLKAFKKEFACNGNIIEDDEHGECIQLQGDQRSKVLQFLTENEISSKDKIKLHGF